MNSCFHQVALSRVWIDSCLVRFNLVLNPLSQILQRNARKSEWTCMCLAKFFLFVHTRQIGHSFISEGSLFLLRLEIFTLLHNDESIKPRKGNNEVRYDSLDTRGQRSLKFLNKKNIRFKRKVYNKITFFPL